MAEDNKFFDFDSNKVNPTNLFGFSIVGGMISIALGTYFESWLLNIGLPIGIMFYYIHTINQDTSDSLSIEQKADSVYYMGFIFTLIAMTASLVALAYREELKFDSIVMNFGLALATTILGLTVRIIWLQLSSQSLSDAESILKERIIRRSQELQDQTEKVVGSMTALSNQLAKISEPLKSNFDQLTNALDVNEEINQNLMDLNRSIEIASENLRSIGSSSERLNVGVSKLNQAINDDLISNIDSLSSSASKAQPKINELDQEISSTVDSINDSLETLNNNIKTTDDMITQSKANMESAGSILNRLSFSVRRFFERK